MSSFTVASGPINFGASGGDEDFFGGNSDQGFTQAAAYTQPGPPTDYPTTSYGNTPWEVSGGYTAQEPATYPAAHGAAPVADAIYQSQETPGYSNPLYDASATYQPPQATGIESWEAPAQTQTATEYSYEQQPAAAPQPPPPTQSPAAQWTSVPAAVASYEESTAKRELSFNENIAFSAPPTSYTANSAPPQVALPAAALPEQPQQQQQQDPWAMPAANPSMNFTDDGADDIDDAALFDQIDATFSENLNDTDSLFSSSTATAPAPAAAADAVTTTAPNSATIPNTAAGMPTTQHEHYGQPFSPPTSMGAQPQSYQAAPPPPPPQAAAPAPPPPPMSPPKFQPPAPYQPPSAAPTYHFSPPPPTNFVQPVTNTASLAAAPPAAAHVARGSSKPLSHNSSLDSSPRPGNINLEAGRRKLEEYKRRKQAVLGARRTPGVSGTSSPLAGSGGTAAAAAAAAAAAVNEKFQAELAAALSRATAAEASNSELSRDLDHVLRQLETVDQERNSLQREKAAMVGEMMSLQTALETATAQAQAQATSSVTTEQYETERRNAEMLSVQVQELETARNDLIELLEKERQEHRQQLEALQMEKDNAVVQGDESSQRASQHVEEVQQWIAATQADSQAVREDNERLRLDLETALAAAAAAVANANASVVIKQEEDQQQQQHQNAYYGAEGLEQPYTNINTAAPASADEVEQALARAATAETAIETLKYELENARQEAYSLREDILRLKSEAAAMDKLHLDSPSNSRRAVNNDPESLRYRLAKAEAAVEKERRMIQSLERQVRDSEAAAAEGRASTAAAFELRRRCDAAEREATAAKSLVEQLQQAAAVSASPRGGGGGSSMPDEQVQQMMSRLRVAEEKATSTDAIATDLRSQCDAAAKTIAKLVEENQNLMDRLNRQGNAMAELQESHHTQHQHQPPSYSPGSPYAAAAPHHRQQQQQHERQHHQEQQQFTTPSPTHTAPPVWNIPGAVPIQYPPPQEGGGGGYYNGREEEIQTFENGGRGGGGRGALPSREMSSPRYSQEDAPGGGKKKGFWSWLAGEDLAGES
jgi:hypothetical protein